MVELSDGDIAIVVINSCMSERDEKAGTTGISCIATCVRLCKQWARVCTSDQLWRELYMLDFGVASLSASETGSDQSSAESWREKYRNRLSKTMVRALIKIVFDQKVVRAYIQGSTGHRHGDPSILR